MGKEKVKLNGKKFYRHPFFLSYATSKSGEILNIKTVKLLKCTENNQGYLTFFLYHERELKNYSVHRFVFESIKGVIPDCYVVDHIDSNRTNNSIYNLQLLSSKENIQKARNRRMIAINLDTEEEKIYVSLTEAGKDLDIFVGNICNICKGRKEKQDQIKINVFIHLGIYNFSV